LNVAITCTLAGVYMNSMRIPEDRQCI